MTPAWPNPPGTPVHRYTVTGGEVAVDLIDLGARIAGAWLPDRAGDRTGGASP
jgi:hypothetical protein